MSNIYKCSVCQEDINGIKSFFAHHDTHADNDDLKYMCMQDDCFKRFRKSSDFRTHVRRLHGEESKI